MERPCAEMKPTPERLIPTETASWTTKETLFVAYATAGNEPHNDAHNVEQDTARCISRLLVLRTKECG
jgi:hypothetical protein